MRVIPILSNQRLYTTDSPTFAGLTLTGSMSIAGDIEMGDGNYIGQAAGPLVRFDDTLDYLEITGCDVGIGTTTPGGQLDIVKAAANATLLLTCYHATAATTPLITMRKAEGTEASHGSPVDDNAVLGTILFQGYDTDSWENGAKIETRIQGTPSSGTDMPAELTFWTTPESSSTMVERMTIDETGFVGIGTVGAAPGTLLQLVGTEAYITLQNSSAENSAGGAETKIIFEDHGNNALGQIEVSHVGSSDDEKGQFIISTNNDSGLQTALTISDTQLATFAGNILIPDAGTIGSASGTSAITIEADSDILLAGQLGIGITPAAQIEISKDSANATLILSCFHGTEATTPLITLRKGEGTAASHATCVDDDTVQGTILFQAYDGNSWANGAKIEARVKGAPSDGDMPSELTFWTTPDASETLVEQMTIGPDGAVVCTSTIAATGASLGTGELTCGSINRAADTLTLEINGTAEISISSTTSTFGGNLIIPDTGYIGAASMTTAIQIETDGDILLAGKLGVGITPAAIIHAFIAATTASTPLEVLRLECNDGGVELDAGMGSAINFYMPHDTASFLGAAIAARKESNVDDAESTNLAFSTCPDAGSNTVRMRIGDTGLIGIGLDVDAGTLLQLALDGNAYLTLQNLTAENSEGGAETRIIFEDHGNNALAQIEGSHSGTSDDTKGKLILSVHNNSSLTTAITIIDTLAVTFAGAISATNYTAANLLTACTTTAGALDFSASSKTLTVEDDAIVSQDYTSDSTTVVLAALGLTASIPTLTFKNSDAENGQDEAESLVKFTDHGDFVLAQIMGAHDGTADDDKGVLVFYANNDTAATEILRLDSALLASFAGAVDITSTITASNYTAAALLTACATNAGGLDFSAASKTLTVADSATIGAVIDDLNSLGAPASDGQFIVATGIGAFQYESTTTARTSLGVGTGDSPAFTAVSLGTGELTAGSINRAADSLLLEIAGTPELSISATASTFGGNIIVPDAADIGSASATNAISISGTGIVDIELHNDTTIGLALAGTLITASAAELNLLDGVSAVQEQADVLDDIINVGTVTNDSYFLVGNGVASFAWETTTTLRTSIGVGTGDSVQLASLKLGTANLKAGALFELAEDAANAELVISCYHNTAGTTPLITMRKAEGTEASHASPVDDNAVLGTINFDGYDTSGYHTGAKIEARIDGTPSDGTDMPTELSFWVCPEAQGAPIQAMTITPVGCLSIGALVPNITQTTHKFAIASTGYSGMSISAYSTAGAASNSMSFLRSKNATVGSHTACADDDILGDIYALGSDGTQFRASSRISFEVDGAVTGGGAADMPGRIGFWTSPDGNASPTIRMTVKADGKVGINDAEPGEYLDVAGNINVTGVYKVDDVQVVTEQQIHIADASTQDLTGTDQIDQTKLEADLAAIVVVINNILTMVETHGLTAGV